MTFLAPWILSALLLLPLIYLLLRIIPPAAQKVVLPTLRFLHDLNQKNPPVQKTPWWIILLRLALLACLIIGLAQPVINPQKGLEGHGPLTLIIDNGWAASQTWSDQQQAALRIAEQARRDNRPIELILTAPLAGDDIPQIFSATSPDQVISQIKGLSASSWPGLPGKVSVARDRQTFWISAGIAEQGYESLLASSDDLTVFTPAAARLPLLLRAPAENEAGSIARVEAPAGAPSQQAQIRAISRKGQMIDQVAVTVSGGQGYVDAISKIDPAVLADTSSVQLATRTGAGAVMMRDRTHNNTRIGMVTADAARETQNLNTPLYYISRAVSPFSTFSTGSPDTLIKDNPGVIVLADGGALPPRTLEEMDTWIKAGGILLRFATPALAEGSDTFTPVKLRESERSLSGSMTWDKPLTIKSFPASSPFAGLPLPTDIKIKRQLLAEPGPELGGRTWVTLSDETPLITAQPIGKGLLVLVHTTATPDWSDLPLSGFYVSIFKTLSEMSARPDKSISELKLLQPLLILNGYGQLVQPPATLKPIERKDFDAARPSALHPPGLYGTPDESLALNLGDRLAPLEPLAPHLKAEQAMSTEGLKEYNAAPLFLGAALALFLIDMAVMLALSGLMLKLRCLLPAMLLFLPQTVHAESDADLAGQIHLAYIRTGDQAIDDISKRGLENLSQALIDRTAVEPGNVVGITPGQDTLAFYPIIYWPVAAAQPDLSPEASKALQAYLDLGGMILLDTRDGIYQPGELGTSGQIIKLRSLMRGLSITPLMAAPADHVFFRTFYLLNFYPELSLVGDIWVEEDATQETGLVSSVVLSGNDWARIWAAEPGSVSATQKEQATRFGVNAVMYALTGNYKADQVHMNAILDRLGRDQP